jgi:DnaJ-domain-containing protein 1
MGNIAAQKDYLIKLISAIDDEAALARFRELLEKMRGQDDLTALLVKHIPETLDVEAIKRRQNWKGVDRAKWDRLIEEMDIQEPVETLLAQLTK